LIQNNTLKLCYTHEGVSNSVDTVYVGFSCRYFACYLIIKWHIILWLLSDFRWLLMTLPWLWNDFLVPVFSVLLYSSDSELFRSLGFITDYFCYDEIFIDTIFSNLSRVMTVYEMTTLLLPFHSSATQRITKILLVTRQSISRITFLLYCWTGRTTLK
jgi:hypothetical protein